LFMDVSVSRMWLNGEQLQYGQLLLDSTLYRRDFLKVEVIEAILSGKSRQRMENYRRYRRRSEAISTVCPGRSQSKWQSFD